MVSFGGGRMGGLWEELAFARNKYFPEGCRLKLPWQMRHSAARHERNGLVSVTFISFSLGNSFTIVVLVALPSKTFTISPFMYELTCQHMLKTVRLLAFFFLSFAHKTKRAPLTITVVVESTYFFISRPDAN